MFVLFVTDAVGDRREDSSGRTRSSYTLLSRVSDCAGFPPKPMINTPLDRDQSLGRDFLASFHHADPYSTL